MHNSNLRSIVATIEGELAQLATFPPGAIPATSVLELQASWARLVGLLALGPEPEVRACPVCSRMVLRAALRCGHCWTKLRPPPVGDA